MIQRWTALTARIFSSWPIQPITDPLRHFSRVAHVDKTERLRPRRDPYTLVAPDLSHLHGNLLGLLGSAHPGLRELARYYFLRPSKQLRSLVILLFSRATNGLSENWDVKRQAAEKEISTGLSEELNRPLTQPDVLNNWHPSMPTDPASFDSVFELRPPRLYRPPIPSSTQTTSHTISLPAVLPTQVRLAQIVEMIHMAGSLHDEIFDPSASEPDPREGFGNKILILGGDFLLGRASTALSGLGESEVVELVGCVISNLVEGEVLRTKSVYAPDAGQLGGSMNLEEAWDTYIKKTYLKTASLMAKAARASVILGGCGAEEIWKDVAYAYGRNLGIAYQVRLSDMVLSAFPHGAGSSWKMLLITRKVEVPNLG